MGEWESVEGRTRMDVRGPEAHAFVLRANGDRGNLAAGRIECVLHERRIAHVCRAQPRLAQIAFERSEEPSELPERLGGLQA
jgi:hypothetical protein